MTNDKDPTDIRYCPYCGSPKIKFVGRVPRCIECRAVFIICYSRYARRSPTKRAL